MCCHHQKPREDNIFIYFSWIPVKAALTIFSPKCLLKQFFERELMKTKETVISADL
jgi:hypothetical protein